VHATQVGKLKKNEQERDFSRRSSMMLGSAWAFAGAVLVICIWLLTGPTFHFSDTWQLIINTATTVITFLMVFLIQNTQNRDAKAMHLKLDEIIRALKGARNQLVDLEDLPTRTSRNSKSNFDGYEQKRNVTERALTRSKASDSAEMKASVNPRLPSLACSQENFAAGT
jgi:low affinity Fe/Cu permease